MHHIKLTPRLRCLAALVPKDGILADVGTDHALLPLYLLQQNKIIRAVATDLRAGPLSRAKENALRYGLLDKLELRLAYGLDAVHANDCNVISIAGMGGETIAAILAAAPWTFKGEHILLMQPMTRSAELRHFLFSHGYAILQEHICQEEDRLYVVIMARGNAERQELRLEECAFSPALLQDPLAKDYITKQLAQATRALHGMERSGSQGVLLSAQQYLVHYLKNGLEGLQ